RHDEASGLQMMGRLAATRAGDGRSWGAWLSIEGLVLQDMGKLPEAEAAYDRAVAIGEKALGPDHPDFARLLVNRAGLYEAKHDLPKAKVAYEHATAAIEKALGADHPDSVSALYDMAIVLDELGDFTQALALNEHALASREATLGPDHPYVAMS